MTSNLTRDMLPDRLKDIPDSVSIQSLLDWQNLGGLGLEPLDEAKKSQRAWDAPLVNTESADILNQAISSGDTQSLARLRAVTSDHSGDWLNAPPLTAAGLRMDNNTVRVAAALRLGAPTCSPHTCSCSTFVDARGTHGLSCTRSAGRSSRHRQINDIVYRALVRAQIGATKEPMGLIPNSNLRPDGVTGIPWRQGKCLVWDATVSDTLAASHLQNTSVVAGSAAKQAAVFKCQKYSTLSATHVVMPISIETFGAWDVDSLSFIKELGRKMSVVTGDPRETQFLLQRISVAIQRGNASSCMGTWVHDGADVD